MRNNSKRNFISKRPTAFIRVRSVIFSLIKTEEIIRSLSCKNPFCAIVKGLRFFKASEEQIPTAMSEETTKRVNYHKNGNLPLFCIEKDTRVGVLYAPFACVPVEQATGIEPAYSAWEADTLPLSYACIFLLYLFYGDLSREKKGYNRKIIECITRFRPERRCREAVQENAQDRQSPFRR